MKKYLVDASVILQSILHESQNVETKLKELLIKAKKGEAEVYSSKLLILEVANGLRFSIKEENICREIFSDFLSLPIKIFDISEIQMEQVIKISYRQNTTIYDTSYHILAKSYGAIFLTCDENYFSKAKKLGEIELIA